MNLCHHLCCFCAVAYHHASFSCVSCASCPLPLRLWGPGPKVEKDYDDELKTRGVVVQLEKGYVASKVRGVVQLEKGYVA